MICRNCLRRLTTRRTLHPSQTSKSTPSPSPTTHLRSLTTTTPRSQATPITAQTATATNPRPQGKPAATSTSAAQPFSAPLTPAGAPSDATEDSVKSKSSGAGAGVPKIVSSVPAGTVLKGLNFVKSKSDPVALEDHEYPAWLWRVLDVKEGMKAGGAAGEGDLFSKSKKQRRIAAKALRRHQLSNPEALAPKVPLYEQSVDLPAGDGTVQGAREAGAARSELTKAMREMRRGKIKEANFLKEMR